MVAGILEPGTPVLGRSAPWLAAAGFEAVAVLAKRRRLAPSVTGYTCGVGSPHENKAHILHRETLVAAVFFPLARLAFKVVFTWGPFPGRPDGYFSGAVGPIMSRCGCLKRSQPRAPRGRGSRGWSEPISAWPWRRWWLEQQWARCNPFMPRRSAPTEVSASFDRYSGQRIGRLTGVGRNITSRENVATSP